MGAGDQAEHPAHPVDIVVVYYIWHNVPPMRSVALLLLIFVAGCTYSLDNLHQSPVKRTERIASPYGLLSTCTKQRFENETLVYLKLWEDRDRGFVRLTAFRSMPLFRSDATFEFMFVRESPALTRIDAHTDDRTDLQPDGRRLSDDVWRAITSCSQQVVPQTAPPP
jgi:hypothetical protein